MHLIKFLKNQSTTRKLYIGQNTAVHTIRIHSYCQVSYVFFLLGTIGLKVPPLDFLDSSA